jgi:prepilin-type N-terminal cleavage/methylation domain-containing protein
MKNIAHASRGLQKRRGFTIAELIVGIVIVSLLAGATAATIRTLTRARNSSLAHRQAFARASDAAQRMAIDASRAVRDADLLACKVEIVDSPSSALTQEDELLVLTRDVAGVRGGERTGGGGEGDEVEVQYRLEPAPRTQADSGKILWRRADSGNDGNVSGGGVATPLTPHVLGLSIEASDGEKWFGAWDSDRDGMPHALRVVVDATDDEGRVIATARRVIAIDRTPIPAENILDEEGDNSGGSPEGETSTPSGGTGTGTGTGGGGA